jgi:hypothetical protein
MLIMTTQVSCARLFPRRFERYCLRIRQNAGQSHCPSYNPQSPLSPSYQVDSPFGSSRPPQRARAASRSKLSSYRHRANVMRPSCLHTVRGRGAIPGVSSVLLSPRPNAFQTQRPTHEWLSIVGRNSLDLIEAKLGLLEASGWNALSSSTHTI